MKQHNWYSTFLLIFVCLLFFSYQNHFDNPFFFDDEHTIVNNTAIREVNIPKFFSDGTTFSTLPSNQSYRPGLTTLNALDVYWGGEDFPVAKQFHKTIFITYVLLAILLYIFFLEIFIIVHPHKWNSMFTLFATSFFILHTSNAETINYIIARSDLISTLMVILAFIFFMYKTRWRKYYIYLVPMIFGFTFKEPALMFIPLLFVYKFVIEEKEGFSFDWKKYLFIVPTLIIAGFILVFYLNMTPVTWIPGGNSRMDYFFTQFYVQLLYLKNFILPTHLSADSDLTVITNIFDIRILLGMLSVLVMLFLAYRAYKIRQLRPVTFGILWFYITLLPTSSVIPFAEVMNDHRTFFPYIGLVLAVVSYISYLAVKYQEKLERNNNLMIAFCLTAVIFLTSHSYGVIKRNEVWDSQEDLWLDVTIKSPKNGRGLMNYGLSQMAKGNYTVAEDYFNRALKLVPNYSSLYINLAILRNATGRGETSEEYFVKALQLDTLNPACYHFYTEWLYNKFRYEEANVLVNKGLKLSPGHAEMQFLKKQIETALVKNQGKIELNSDQLLNMSLQLYQVGNYNGCINLAKQALKIKSDFAEAFNNISCSYNQLGKYDSAIIYADKGLAINPTYELLKNNRAFSIRKEKIK